MKASQRSGGRPRAPAPSPIGSAQGAARPSAATASRAAVANQVAALEGTDRPALLALWAEVLGGSPPRSVSQPFLRRVLAWELQARAQGGLPAAARRKLEALGVAGKRAWGGGSAGGGGDDADAAADPRGAGAVSSAARSPRLKPGGRLLREWNGITHVVDVVEGGFLWRGSHHRSLSAIAEAITGAHWSGPRFFGLKAATAKAGAADAPGARRHATSSSRRAA